MGRLATYQCDFTNVESVDYDGNDSVIVTFKDGKKEVFGPYLNIRTLSKDMNKFLDIVKKEWNMERLKTCES
jgi:hypothetical protein